MTWDDDMWQAAELVDEWQSGNLTYKLHRVPAEASGGDSDGQILIGVDSTNVRRVEEWINIPGRECNQNLIAQIMRERG